MRRLRLAYVLSYLTVATALGGDPIPEALTAGATLGNPPRRPIVPPDCPPGTLPFDPSRPPTPPTTDPGAQPPATDPLARAPEAGTLSPGTFNPNMFGDLFGARPRTIIRPRLFQTIIADSAGQPITYTGFVNTTNLDQTPGTFIVLRDNGRASGPFQTHFQTAIPIPFSGNVPLLENSVITNQLKVLNPGATVQFLSPPSLGLQQTKGGGSQGLPADYFIQQGYQIGNPFAFMLPSGGGVVGRTKIADDNSPVPGDRAIFQYDQFGGTVLAPGGYDVYRFSVGGEMSLLDGWASAELRLPFASTLDPIGSVGGLSNRATEFGNLNFVLKALALRSDALNLAGGVGISFPTAADAVLQDTNGTELLRVKNQSYLVTPFLAAQIIPATGWFAQAWVQVSFDMTGSDVLAAPNGMGPVTNVGRVYDQPLLQTDFQLGYWLIRDETASGLRGLAPFIELHYNRPFGTADSIFAPGVALPGGSGFNEVNLSVGAAALIGSNLLVNVGMAFPLREGTDRFFDYQLGIRANWFFGAGGGARDAFAAAPAGGMPGTAAVTPGMEGMPPGSPPVDPLARAPETGTLAQGTFNPNFFGDLIGINSRQSLSSATAASRAQIPLLPRYAGLKPTDNDGPRPSDRVYFSYNQYSDVNGAVNSASIPNITLRRQIVGFETLIGDDASIGVRLPFLQMNGADEAREMADISIVAKCAVVNDPCSGNVATLGLTLTLPTGGRGSIGALPDGISAPRAVLVQPWVGAVWNSDDWFVEGISAVVLPTDPIYPVVAFNSVGVGYWLYRNGNDRLLRAIVPVAELHVNTPITNRGPDASILLSDQFNLTTGVYFQFPRMTIGTSVCIPLAGPRPYDLEAMVSVNYQF
jgi:hypothetical protein